MLLGTLRASLSGNLLTGKGTVRTGEGTVRAGYDFSVKRKALISPHHLTNFEIKEYYENELRFNGVHSRDNLLKTIKTGACVINLDEYPDVGTHWTALYGKNNEVIYFDSFGVEHVPKEIKKFIGHKNTKTNIVRIQADNSIMRGYFCIRFIDFMLAGKNLLILLVCFLLIIPKNDNIILSYFK